MTKALTQLSAASVLAGVMLSHAAYTGYKHYTKTTPKQSFMVSFSSGTCFLFKKKEAIKVSSEDMTVESKIKFSKKDEPVLVYPYTGDNTFFSIDRCEEVK